MSLVREIHEQVRAGGLLPAERQVVAMLSGGRDSVCLLDVAVTLCGARKVVALHVDYGLREQATGDREHCRMLCERLGVELDVVRARREPDVSGNLHAWAREARYAAAHELAERREALVATGHTATDQVETILYRLAASPGRRALLGMAPSDGRTVRPLLGVSREQTAAYCVERGLGWREDESNDSLEYARARVRNRLLPALETIHPAATANVLRTAALLREESAALDALIEAELKSESSISIERLSALPPALARLVIVRMAEQATGALVPQAGERVAEIVALARRGGQAELHVGGLARAVIEDGELRMRSMPPRRQRPPRSRSRRKA
jgi:tRNA(Ile)-lysidine synthase